MLKIENVVLPSPEQWFAVIRGMRNPKNSWDKSDSYKSYIESATTDNTADFTFCIGENDYDLAKRLAIGGSVHGKFKRMIPVYLDITAPLYWWKEFDTYKVGTVANGCSTMHKIHAKKFEPNDFSYDHLDDIFGYEPEVRDMAPTIDFKTYTEEITNYLLGPEDIVNLNMKMLNRCRELYLKTNEKTYWWQLIQLLPSSYNQRRTVMLNYEVLTNIYQYRMDHKLDEWHTVCDWIETLPYSEFITGNYPEGYPY